MNRRFAEIAFSPRDTRNVGDFQFVSFRPAVPLPSRARARNGYTFAGFLFPVSPRAREDDSLELQIK